MKEPQIGEVKGAGQFSIIKFRTDLVCPHCGYFAEAEGPQIAEKYLAVKCRKCNQAILIHFNLPVTAANKKVVDYYPKNKLTVDAFVPQEIAHDYLEAQRCFSAGAWQGCAVMARRCMHGVAHKFQAQGSDLYKQIEDLKNQQRITPLLADMAQRVRVMGRDGAHPYDVKGNAFAQLDIEDARLALEFCEMIFDQLFVLPGKVDASKSPPAKQNQ